MIYFNPNTDLCPCESGKLLRDCCMGPDNRLRTSPSVVRPRGQKTGFSNVRCYASEIADCSRKLSREHSVSHGILKVLASNGNVTIEGFNWQQENKRKGLSACQRPGL